MLYFYLFLSASLVILLGIIILLRTNKKIYSHQKEKLINNRQPMERKPVQEETDV